MKKYKNIELKTKKFLDQGFGQWIVTIKDKDWKGILELGKKSIVEQLEIPGFRKGKVPKHIAEQHINNEEKVLKNSANKAVKIAYQYGLDHQEDYDIKVTSKPEVEIQDVNQNECKIIFNFDLPLHVELKKYKKLDIVKPTIKVSKNEIDQQINLLKNRFAIYNTKEKGKLERGNIAIFNFKGTIDGKEFPGNSGKNFELEIGSKRFIPGFEDQMIGMKTGENKVIKVKFPKDYHVANLASKDAKFTINLKEIKIKTINDNNEELVQDMALPNVKTYDELINHIKSELTKQKTNAMRQEIINEIFISILKSSKIVIPKSVINNETNRLINEFKKELSQKNVTLEQYKNMTGFSDEMIRIEAQKDAIWQLQTFIITEEVIKAEKIDATEGEIEDYLKLIAAQFNMSLEQIKKTIKDLNSVSMTLKRKKALDWLFDNNCKTETKIYKTESN